MSTFQKHIWFLITDGNGGEGKDIPPQNEERHHCFVILGTH